MKGKGEARRKEWNIAGSQKIEGIQVYDAPDWNNLIPLAKLGVGLRIMVLGAILPSGRSPGPVYVTLPQPGEEQSQTQTRRVSVGQGRESFGDRLQRALASTPPRGGIVDAGATIADGVISRPIILDKPVTLLLGSGKLQCKAAGPAFVVATSDVQIVGEQTELSLEKGCTFGVKFEGDIRGVVVRGLKMHGIADPGQMQTGAGYGTWENVRSSNLTVEHNEIYDVTRGIYIESNYTDGIAGALVQHNYLHNIVGTQSGAGYGIVFSQVRDGKIQYNRIERAQRHSIYQAAGVAGNNLISDNIIRFHRNGIVENADRNAQMAAVVIARSSNIVFTRNTVEQAIGTAVSVEPHDSAPIATRHVSVTGNTFIGNGMYDIGIGSEGPGVTGLLSDVVVTGNVITRSKASDTEAVRIRSGKEIDVESNTIWAMNDYRVPQAMILLVGAGGSTFTDNVIIRGNTISVTALPPGSAHAVRITQAIADGSSHVLIEGNKLRLDGKPSLMLYDSSPKNHNILILNNNNGGN